MSLKCAVPGCAETTMGEQVMCRGHWRLVPPGLRDALWMLRNGPGDRPRPGYEEAVANAVLQALELAELPRLDPATSWPFRDGNG